MIATQAKPTPACRAWPRTFLRLGSIGLLAACLSWGVHRSMEAVDRGRPAGFRLGMLHGALMPCALPNLLFGRDVNIYAEHNSGRTYKLGYTLGVNACGAIFFGLSFWRISRWMKRGQALSVASASAP